MFSITQCSHMSDRIHVPRCPCFQLLNAHPCQSVPMSLDVLVSYYSMITHVRVYPCPQTSLFPITQCSHMSECTNVPRRTCVILLNAHSCQKISMSPDVLVSYYSMLTHVRVYQCPQTYLFYITQCLLMSERIHVPRCPCFLLLNAHTCQSVSMSPDVLVFYYSMLTHVRAHPCP